MGGISLLKRYSKKETFIYDDEKERDMKALQYGGGVVEVKMLTLLGDKDEYEDDEYLLEITTSYDVEENDNDFY